MYARALDEQLLVFDLANATVLDLVVNLWEASRGGLSVSILFLHSWYLIAHYALFEGDYCANHFGLANREERMYAVSMVGSSLDSIQEEATTVSLVVERLGKMEPWR